MSDQLASAPARQRRHRTPDELVEEVLPYVLQTGLTDFSLRAAATELGTSHKVLLHHFGSRAGLIAAVLRRLREQLLADTRDPDPLVMLARGWDWHAEHAAESRVLHQGLGLGIVDPDEYGPIVTDSVAQYMVGAPAGREAFGRLALAAVRGLQIDRAITGDEAGTAEAFAALGRLLRAAEQSGWADAETPAAG